jgi:hypothetical protein
VLKRKKEIISKEKLSEKIKGQMLNKKKKREEEKKYLTVQKVVKDYREKQKSHSVFKRKLNTNKIHTTNFYDKSREGKPVMVVRISG